MSFALAISVPTLVAPCVGIGFALARIVPTPVDSHVGISLALANTVPTSLVLFTLTSGWACVRHGGRGLTCVNYSCSYSGTQKSQIS